MELAAVRTVFVRAPNWVGDFVMATGAFERIRAAFPDARLILGARPNLLGLLSGTSWVDEVLESPRAGGLRGLRAQARALRAHDCDLAIVLPNSLETGLVAFMAGIPIRLGYRQGRPGLMNRGLRATPGRTWFRRHGPRRIPKPMPTYYRELLDVIGLPPGPEGTILRTTPSERAEAEAWIAAQGIDPQKKLVLITAGASYGASKLWERDKFVAVARALQARGDVACVFLSGPAELEMVEALAAESGAVAATRPIYTMGLLKAMAERCDAMLTTDTGPRHIAVAFDRPIVCLMGPNDPRYTNYSLERTALIRKDLPCMPCQLKTCPLGHHDCMRKITVDEVLGAVERALG